MTYNPEVVARLQNLVDQLNAEISSIRVHCENGCGDHDTWGIRLYSNGREPHILIYPGDTIIDDHLSDYDEEEEEEEEESIVWHEAPSEGELEDQARNDWQKSQPSTGDPIEWVDVSDKDLDEPWLS